MQEEWRTVVINDEVYDNYEVSNYGNVKNIKYNRLIKQVKDKGGYLIVCLSKNKKHKNFKVHRLVASVFLVNDDVINKTQVNHIDENKENNMINNLEWVTPRQNINHGTCVERRAKNNSKKVRCVETGIIYSSTVEAGRANNCSHSDISRCCKGKQKHCGGFHWEYYNERD